LIPFVLTFRPQWNVISFTRIAFCFPSAGKGRGECQEYPFRTLDAFFTNSLLWSRGGVSIFCESIWLPKVRGSGLHTFTRTSVRSGPLIQTRSNWIPKTTKRAGRHIPSWMVYDRPDAPIILSSRDLVTLDFSAYLGSSALLASV